MPGTQKSKSIARVDLSFRLLIYKEDDSFVAHVLEPDIVGCGDDSDEAAKEAIAALSAQITFAFQTKDLSLLDCPAPQEYFDRWEERHQQQVKALICQIDSEESDLDARWIPFLTEDLMALEENAMLPVSCG